MATIHGAPFNGQPNEASQQANTVLLSTQDISDGKANHHLLGWGSRNIHRIIHRRFCVREQLSCACL